MAINLQNLQSLATGLPPELQQSLGGVLRAQDGINQQIATALSQLSAWTWLTPQLTNGWQSFSSTLVARYAKLSCGLVVLSGAIKSGTLSTTAFTLPLGYRPGQDLNLSAWSDGETDSKLFINSAGSVQPQAGSTTIFSIDCVFLGDG